MLRLNLSSMTLTIQRDLPVKRSIARGLSNFDVAAQLVGSTVGSVWKLLRKKVDGSLGIVPMIHAFYDGPRIRSPGAGRTHRGDASRRRASVDLARRTGVGAAGDRLMKVLVTGATGFVGSYLTRELLRRGNSVRILARSPERAAALQAAGAEVRLGDLGEAASIQGLAEGIEVIFHLASAIGGSAAMFEQIDVRGTEQLLAEAERAGVRRLVYVGTLCGLLARRSESRCGHR